MKPETTAWIEKAEGDWTVAQREVQSGDPIRDVVCFLCQQCAEKYMKAYLEEKGTAFKKTHDLVVLLNAAGNDLKALSGQKNALARLSTFGIAARYPGVNADDKAMSEALETARTVRAALRQTLFPS